MKVWVFVEGRSDIGALKALWDGWRRKLGERGWGIQFISLENKHKYLRKIGAQATGKLVGRSTRPGRGPTRSLSE